MLPAKGLVARASENPNVDPNVTDFLVTLSGHTRSARPFRMRTARLSQPLPINVLDSVHEDGVKLVSIDPEKISDLHLAFPGVRLVPEVFFHKAVVPMKRIKRGARKLARGKRVNISVTNETGDGVKGAFVVAFIDFDERQGAEGTTNARGMLSITLPQNVTRIERLYIYPKDSYWPFMKKNVRLSGPSVDIQVTTIDPEYRDAIKHFYGKSGMPPVTGTIKVAVIDSGVSRHKEINLVGGECTVDGERNDDYHDYDGHGTHVAGIISSFASTADQKPVIEILSYRVFPKDGSDASNYYIVKAIDRAVESGCLLINMSLGGGDPDDAMKDAISDAQSKGVVCFVATGNDDRGPVCFPASYSLSIAVGAMGRKGTFPKDAEANDAIKAPYGSDRQNFVASFSNIGMEVDLIAPGVGIVSCAPDNKYAAMNGTSMACPAATGITARLLLQEGSIIKQPADSNRANSIIKFFSEKVRSLGFTPRYEGKGMIFP